MKELLERFMIDKDILLELIELDNDIMGSSYTYDNYYDALFKLSDTPCKDIILDMNSLFIIDGNPVVLVDLLRRLKYVDKETIIFINQGFVGINSWLMKQFYEITQNSNIELDRGINYNKYINKDYKIVPLGEVGIVDSVLEDFYG